MGDQDTPWEGLPPAPPGVPDQAPKPTGAPPAEKPNEDPWARPPGWRPPSPRRSGLRTGSSIGGPPTIVKLLLGFGAFIVLSTCVRMLPNALPDPDRGDEGRPAPAVDPGPAGVPTVARPFRLVRDGPAPDAPAGWFRYVSSDGSFSVVGPGRPDSEVTRRGGRYTFRADGMTLTAEVTSARGGGPDGRARMERATAIFLDDLGAIEQARRWSGFGDDVALDVDARRGEEKFRIRTFADARRTFRTYARWEGALAEGQDATVEAFLMGLELAPGAR